MSLSQRALLKNALREFGYYFLCHKGKTPAAYYQDAIEAAIANDRLDIATQYARSGLDAPLPGGMEPIPAFYMQQAHKQFALDHVDKAELDAFSALSSSGQQISVDESCLMLTQIYNAIRKSKANHEAEKMMLKLFEQKNAPAWWKAQWCSLEAKWRAENNPGADFPAHADYDKFMKIAGNSSDYCQKTFAPKMDKAP
ncbi:MAG: hypothetical protein ACRD3W_29730 [Terriglobales bacterium]